MALWHYALWQVGSLVPLDQWEPSCRGVWRQPAYDLAGGTSWETSRVGSKAHGQTWTADHQTVNQSDTKLGMAAF